METNNYWTFSVAHKENSSYSTVLKRGYIFTNYIIYRLDCKNKEYEVVTDLYNFTQIYDSFIRLYNQFIGSQQGIDATKRVLFKYDAPGIYKIYDVSTNKINTVINDNKIIINNNMYELNDDLSQGNLVKENVIEDYVDNQCLIQIASNYFIETTNTNLVRRLYYFDETINKFSLVTSVSNINSSTPGGSYRYLTAKFYSANSTSLGMIKFNFSSELIGYVINRYTFSINSATILKNDKVLEGNIVYNVKGATVLGTMPNNGVLNYIPSTSQQTIPAGYTSGGTIEAVSMTEQDIQEAEDIISDLFGNSNYTYDTPIYDLCKTDTIVNDIGSTKFNIVDISAENTIKDRDLVESIASALENSEKSSLGIYITVYDTVNKTANVSVNGCVQPYIYAYKNNDQIKLNIMLQNNDQNENYILYVDGLTNTFSGVSENGWYHRYDYNDFDGSYLNVQYIGDLPQSVYNNVLSHQYAYNIVDYSHNSDNLKLAAKILDSIIHLKIEEVN